MGRPSKGWQLRQRAGRPYECRFTHAGREFNLGTGAYDRDEASRIAAELYADSVRGARRVARRTPAGGKSFKEAASAWLTSIAATIDPETRATYALYAETHWAPRWPTVESMSNPTIADHVRARLRHVQAPTVRKENSALRSFVAWLDEKSLISEPLDVPSIPKRTLGTVHASGARHAVDLSPDEVRELLKRLPLRDRFGTPMRAYFVLMYETSLRPATLAALSVPEHWRPGLRELHITRELDKARAGRPVPITRAAVRALTSSAPAAGVIFGEHDFRVSLRKAAAEVLDAYRAERITPYDFRRARLTHWAEVSDNLPGIQELAGHKHVSTTAKYVRPSRRAAEDVLRVSGTRRRRRPGN